uniref:hypothetical protein n=1 Tax=Chromobacterium amazonense TaxID=1382803 RepID=UPI003F79D5D6
PLICQNKVHQRRAGLVMPLSYQATLGEDLCNSALRMPQESRWSFHKDVMPKGLHLPLPNKALILNHARQSTLQLAHHIALLLSVRCDIGLTVLLAIFFTQSVKRTFRHAFDFSP